MSWVRLWREMPTDPKWRVIARRSGRPIPEVIAVFITMMVKAGENAGERGAVRGWSDEDVGAALDVDAEAVAAIRAAMQGKVLDGDRLTGWDRRQPKREDGSAERAREWRENRKAERTQANAGERVEPPRSRADTDSKAAAAADRDELKSRCEAAAGMRNLAQFGKIIALVNEGIDVDRRIIPMIRTVAADLQRSGKTAGTWAYFVPAIRDGDRHPEEVPDAQKAVWIGEGLEFAAANRVLTANGDRAKKAMHIPRRGYGNWFPEGVASAIRNRPESSGTAASPVRRPRVEPGSAMAAVVQKLERAS